MNKQPRFFLLFPALLLALVCIVAGAELITEPAASLRRRVPVSPQEEWYLSNAAGMTLEKQSSPLAALRNKYSLSVSRVPPSEIPDLLREYHRASWIIEVHTLFENGEESRRQWIFRDEKGTTRVVAAFDPPAPEDDPPAAENVIAAPDVGINDTVSAENDDGAASEDTDVPEPPVQASLEGKAPFGFIELYDENSLITAEHQLFDEGDELVINYTYNKGLLIRTETRYKFLNDKGEEIFRAVNTDSYWYSRAASLRAVERVYHEKLAADEGYLVRHQFPHRILDSVKEENFVNPAMAYGSDFLEDIFIESGYKVLYNTNEQGRILSETHQDDEGNIIGELQNAWSGSKLGSVTWKAGEDERRTEYEYDGEGNRIEERNYYKGTLERVVRRENKREVEELYMNGVVILRAIWEDGRKISEERVRPNTPPEISGAASPGISSAVPPENLQRSSPGSPR